MADRYVAERPLAPLCTYDADRIDGIDAIVCAHPLQGPAAPVFAVYVVDLSPLSFMDARAALTLHQALMRRRAAGRTIVLAGAPGAVRRVWDLCGFDGSVFEAA